MKNFRCLVITCHGCDDDENAHRYGHNSSEGQDHGVFTKGSDVFDNGADDLGRLGLPGCYIVVRKCSARWTIAEHAHRAVVHSQLWCSGVFVIGHRRRIGQIIGHVFAAIGESDIGHRFSGAAVQQVQLAGFRPRDVGHQQRCCRCIDSISRLIDRNGILRRRCRHRRCGRTLSDFSDSFTLDGSFKNFVRWPFSPRTRSCWMCPGRQCRWWRALAQHRCQQHKREICQQPKSSSLARCKAKPSTRSSSIKRLLVPIIVYNQYPFRFVNRDVSIGLMTLLQVYFLFIDRNLVSRDFSQGKKAIITGFSSWINNWNNKVVSFHEIWWIIWYFELMIVNNRSKFERNRFLTWINWIVFHCWVLSR